MAKQKKRKKKSSLSAQEQDLVSLLKMPNNPTALTQQMQQSKIICKHMLELMGTQSLHEPPKESSKVEDFLYRKEEGDPSGAYAGLMKMAMQGRWMSNRVVYDITPELVDFVKSDYWLFRSSMNNSQFIDQVCADPIVLNLSGVGSKEVVMVGEVSILPPSANDGAVDRSTWINLVAITYGEQTRFHFYSEPDTSVSLSLQHHEQEDDILPFLGLPIMNILIYLGYLKSIMDENGKYLVPRSESSSHYQVFPMEKRPDDPVPGAVPEWANSGLRMLNGYMDKENFLRDTQGRLEATGVDLSQKVDACSPEFAEAILYRGFLDWEKTRTIYLLDQEAGEKLVDKYGDKIMDAGFLSGLESYMPTRTFIVSYMGTQTFLVSEALVEGEDGPRVFIEDISSRTTYIIGFLDTSASDLDFLEAPGLKEAACAVKHILLTMKQREEKKLATAPVTVKASGTALPAKTDKPSMPKAYEGGGISLDIPMTQMFEITARTVKKLSTKELVQRHGWTMTPHTRRRHAHRYWVGKGENRHLEVRWLEDMQINANLEKGDAVAAVIRKIS